MAHGNQRLLLADSLLIKKISALLLLFFQFFSLFLISFPALSASLTAEKSQQRPIPDFLTPSAKADEGLKTRPEEVQTDKMSSLFSELAPKIQDNGLSGAAKQQGQTLLNGAVSTQIENGLALSGGKAKVSIETGLNESEWNYGLDYLYPWHEGANSTLFSQFGTHRWNERNIINLGLGYRENITADLLMGGNLFIDLDATRHHSRIGSGVELGNSRLRTSINYYQPLSGWKKSHDDMFNEDTFRFQLYERAAKGWDLNLKSGLSQHTSADATFFQWYGDKVDVLGTRNDASRNPFGLTLGLNWQPVSLVGFNVKHSQISDQKGEWNAGLSVNWDFSRSFTQQMDPSQASALTSLIQSRHDFVTRNNNIVLAYKQENKLQRIYFDPLEASIKALSGEYLNAVKGGNGGHIAYASSNPLLAEIEPESGRVKPLKQGKVQVSAYEYAPSGSQVPVGTARYSLDILPADVAPAAQNVTISGEAKVGSVIRGHYDFVTNEGAEEHPEGSEISWYRSNDLSTAISHVADYTLTAADLDQTLMFEVIPVNAAGLKGEATQVEIAAPVITLQALSLVPVNGIEQEDKSVKFRQGTAGSIEAKVQVIDENGSPVAKYTVHWREQSAPLGTLSQTTSVSDTQGYASVYYNNIQKAGAATLAASLDEPASSTTPYADQATARNSQNRVSQKELKVRFSQPKALTFTSPPTEAVIGSGKMAFAVNVTDEEEEGIAATVIWSANAQRVAESSTDLHGVANYSFDIPNNIAASEDWTITAAVKDEALTGSVTLKLLRQVSPPLEIPDDIVGEFAPDEPRIQVVVTGGNGGPLQFSSDNQNTAMVSTSGELLLLAKGKAKITVSQAATERFASPEAVTFNVIVNAAKGQALEQLADREVTWGDKPLTIKPKGGNGGSLTFSSSDAKSVAVGSKTGALRWVKPGAPVTIMVTESPSANFQMQSMKFKITLRKKASEPLIPPANIAVAWQEPSRKIIIKGGNEGAFTLTSSHPEIVSVDNMGNLIFGQVGEATITVSQGETDYLLAPTAVTFTVKVAPSSGNSLGALPPLKVVWGDAPQQPKPAGGNGGELLFSSNAPAIVSVERQTGLLAYHQAGSALITVTEPAHGNTLTQQISYTVEVKRKKSLPLIKPDNIDVMFGEKERRVAFSGGNGGEVFFTSSNVKSVTVKPDGMMSFVGAGKSTVTLSQSSTATQTQPDPVQFAITVGKIAGNPLTGLPKHLNVAITDKPQQPVPTTSNGGILRYSSTDKSIVDVDAGTGALTYNNVGGPINITVFEAESTNYAAQQASYSVTVKAGPVQKLVLVAEEKQPVANGADSLTFSVVAKDLHDNPVINQEIKWSSPQLELSHFTSLTDQQGKAEVQVKAVLGGKHQLMATAAGVTSSKEVLFKGVPETRELVIIGTPSQGNSLEARYRYFEFTGKPEEASKYHWQRWHNGVAQSVESQTTKTYQLSKADIGATLSVTVTPRSSEGIYGVAVTSPRSAAVTGFPEVKNVAISGKVIQGELLTATYQFIENGAGKEKGSSIHWLRRAGDKTEEIYQSIQKTYRVNAADVGAQIWVEVIPKNVAGMAGTQQKSVLTAPVIGLPIARNLQLSGMPKVGQTLSVTYDYDSQGGAAEAATDIKWYKMPQGGKGATAVGTGRNYLLKPDDVKHLVYVEVMPVSASGLKGKRAQSNSLAILIPPSAGFPQVKKDRLEVGYTVSASYTFAAQGGAPESGSTIQWMRKLKGNQSPISGAIYKEYLLTREDIGAAVSFTITPRNSDGIEGEAKSSPFEGNVQPAKAASLQLDKSHAELRVGGEPVILTATVKNALNKPIVGEVVRWSSALNLVSFDRKETITDEQGRATVAAQAPNKYRDYNDEVTAQAGSNNEANGATEIVFIDIIPRIKSHTFTGKFMVGEKVGISIVFEDNESLQYVPRYQWKLNGKVLPKATGQFLTLDNPDFAGQSLSVDVTPVNWAFTQYAGKTQSFNAPAVQSDSEYDIKQLRYDIFQMGLDGTKYTVEVKVVDQHGKPPKSSVNVCFRIEGERTPKTYYMVGTGNNSSNTSIVHEGAIFANVNVHAIVCDKYLTTDKPFFDDGRVKNMDSGSKNVWLDWQ